MLFYFFFFCKQKTAYDLRISDWSSDVCSSDLCPAAADCSSGTLKHCSALFGAQDVVVVQYPDAKALGPIIARLNALSEVRSEETDSLMRLFPVPMLSAVVPPLRETLLRISSRSILMRSDKSRVGKEGVRTGRSRWSP